MTPKVIETIATREIQCEKFGLGVTPTAVGSAFTITNHTQDLAMDCNTAADAEIADVLGEVISQLIDKGILSGTVT